MISFSVLIPQYGVFSQRIKGDAYLNDPQLAASLGISEEHDVFVTRYTTNRCYSNCLQLLIICSSEKLVIYYKIKEYSPLLDSSNLGVNEWIHIANDIKVLPKTVDYSVQLVIEMYYRTTMIIMTVLLFYMAQTH